MSSENSARLAATKDIPIDRLLEIAMAERDGRLVVSPLNSMNKYIKEAVACYRELPAEDTERGERLESEICGVLWAMMNDGSFDHIEKLLSAELDGRLLVLPACKVGDLLWYVTPFGKIRSVRVEAFVIGQQSRQTAGVSPIVRTKKWDIAMEQVGRSVFLTRQEAVALREQMKKDARWS